MIKGTVNTDGISIKYAAFGSGQEKLVIIPGLSLKPVTDEAAAVETAMKMLSDRYTVYIIDRNVLMDEDSTARSMAEDTVTAMKTLGIAKADFYGASQGGMIAMCIAAHHPEMTGKMVLASSAHIVSDYTKNVCSEWIKLAEEKNEQALIRSFAEYVYSGRTLKTALDTILKLYSGCTDNQLRLFITGAKAVKNFDFSSETDRVRCRTLVIGSSGDRVLGADSSPALAEALNCRLNMYGSEYGHGVYDEAPDFIKVIYGFLAEDRL